MAALRVIRRTVADSVSSISDVVTRLGMFGRTIRDAIRSLHEAVRGPYVPPTPTVVGLTIGGISVWADTEFANARFESQVNGVAGTCKFRVRDLNRTKSFTTGQEVLLTINGKNVWRGFVQQVDRVYAFPALNVTDFGLTRFIDITGADINLLLIRRVAFDKVTPANTYGTLFPVGTADTTAIADLIANFLDLTGDGIDTTSLVENVADITVAQEGRAWSASDKWADAMGSIARLPGAIFYIDPDKKLVYTDVDSPSAPFDLSDQYDSVTSFGYREMEILADGTGLANDVLAWGIGFGPQIFKRDQDAVSLAAHGLWQTSSVQFGVYKQATLDYNASSILNGSPENLRGAKDDRMAVTCVTYEPGLRVADKVTFTSTVFGFTDVIPVRKMAVVFEAPATPRYELTLSHEIDTPFDLIDDYLLPNFTFGGGFRGGGFNGGCPPPFIAGPGGACILPPGQIAGQTCARFTFEGIAPAWITVDSFSRTVATHNFPAGSGSTFGSYWGTADGTFPVTMPAYIVVGQMGSHISGDAGVAGGLGFLLLDGVTSSSTIGDIQASWAVPGPTVYFEQSIPKFEVRAELVDTYSITGSQLYRYQYINLPVGYLTNVPDDISGGGEPFNEGLWFSGPLSGSDVRVSAHLAAGATYLIRVEMDRSGGAGEVRLYVDNTLIHTTAFTGFSSGVLSNAVFGAHVKAGISTATGTYGMNVDYWRGTLPDVYDPIIDIGPYTAGTLAVTIGGVAVPLGSGSPYYYEETDPAGGTISVFGLVNGDVIQVCVPACGPTSGTYAVFDDFSRVLPTTWGLASSGPAWNLSLGTHATASVDGAVGTLAVVAATSQTAEAFVNSLDSSHWITLPFTMAIDVDHLTDGGGSGPFYSQPTVFMALQDSVPSPNQLYFDFQPYTSVGGLPGSRLSTTLAGPQFDSDAAMTSGTIYIQADFAGVTVTNGGTSLTQPWRTRSGSVMTITSARFVRFIDFDLLTSSGGGNISFGINEIRIKDSVNYGQRCSFIGINGFVSEDFVSTGGATVALGVSYLPNSAQVWVAGLLLRPVTDYTEDPTGAITFAVAPTVGATIHIAFYSLG